jgi:hypothetical protein
VKILLRSLFCAALGGLASSTFAQPTTDAKEGLAELVVPVDKPSEFLQIARATLDDVLGGFHPEPKAAPRTEVVKTGQFVLWGDLFETGDCFALTELTPQRDGSENYGVAFAEWRDGAWQLRQLWRISTTWRPEGWTAKDDYLPATPATKPFALRDLGGGRTPELIVAGEVAKYFQEQYLFRFSPRTKTLTLVASAMGDPMVVDKYVVLPFDSGRRSIWQEWQFNKWAGDELVPVASWHDEVGYGTEDPTFSEGERFDARGGHEVIRIVYGKGQEFDADSYELIRDGKPFGRLRVMWKDKENAPSDADEIEKSWFFEKITGLPRVLFPESKEAKPVGRLEDFATMTVEGNEEASKFFKMGR